jgi:glutamine synthetase
MRSTGVADTAYFGPELELFVFDEVRHDQTPHFGYYYTEVTRVLPATG